MTKARLVRGAIVVVASLAAPVAALAQRSTSAATAQALTQEMARREITTVAARDPDQAGMFVAATYLPGVQLLAVSAASTAPVYLDQLLAAKRYDEVYASLNGASLADGKLFVQDMRADGLAAAREDGSSFDIVYQNVTKTIMFNGNWKKQQLTEAQYRSAFATIDARYAHMLSLLLQQLRSGS